jgi:hypothetical protein
MERATINFQHVCSILLLFSTMYTVTYSTLNVTLKKKTVREEVLKIVSHRWRARLVTPTPS